MNHIDYDHITSELVAMVAVNIFRVNHKAQWDANVLTHIMESTINSRSKSTENR